MKHRGIARMAAGALAAARTATSSTHSAPAPAAETVTFDPRDGQKRVVITVGTDGVFAPVAFYGMAGGLAEAGVIAAHGALIVAESILREVARASGVAVRDGE